MKLAGQRFLIGFILVFLVELCKAQLPDLIPYRKGNLWGYCDSNKVVKIEPKYAFAGWFDKNGVAAVGYYCADEYSDSEVCTEYINRPDNEQSELVERLGVKSDNEKPPAYYKDNDSCYNILNINGKVFKLCEKGELYLLNKNFIIFISKNSLLKVYNSKGKFLGEGFQENREFAEKYRHPEGYFVCNDSNKTIMLNTEGEKIILPNHYLSAIFPIYNTYFFSYNWGKQGINVLVFNSKGEVLKQYNPIRIREEEIHFFEVNTPQENNLKYPTSLLFPLIKATCYLCRETGAVAEKPKLLSITPQGIKEIELNFKNISHIELVSDNSFGYYDGPQEITALFNKVILLDWGAYENSFYVDVYGTIYYDE